MSMFARKPQPLEDDDDLYEGYNNSHAAAGPVSTVAGKGFNDMASVAQMRMPTAFSGTSAGLGNAGGDVRPMTSVRGAGYSSGSKPVFDPFQQGAPKGPAPPLQKRSETSPEHMARELEREVHTLLEESATFAAGYAPSAAAQTLSALGIGIRVASVAEKAIALEKAKEAIKKERALCKHREKNGLGEQINHDLTYAVNFNLANQLTANQMYNEALTAYSAIVKNKQFSNAGRLRVNMGNIYFIQKKYPAAIKMYRMAMDQVGNLSKEMRFKIMRNIALSFIRLGQFADAVHSLETVMENCPDPKSGFNLIVCYYALGDTEKMKKAFLQLIAVPQYNEREEEEEAPVRVQSRMGSANSGGSRPASKAADSIDALLPVKEDDLTKEYNTRQKEIIQLVRVAAKLISPVVEHDFAAGFDWTIEALKQPTDSPRNHNESRFQSSNGENATKTTTTKSRHTLEHVAAEMEIAKGVAYLKKREFARAIEVFRAFEKREQTLLDQAATNLSFLYFLEGDYKAAEKHAEFAVKADRYNARALVNRANCLFVRGELEAAKEVYLEAIGVEADCVEAIYNLGLVNKRLDNPGDALQAFRKLHRIVPKSVTVIYQIANLFEMLNDHSSAAEWFKILHGAVPTDPKVLARLGNIFSNEDDHTQAFHNYLDSYRHMPTNMEVITWLGVWYVKSELYEPAIQYFERAAEIEPQEVKWRLMVASCYRRMGAYQKALELYREIHHTDSDNIECLRYLCTITKDLGDKSHEEYAKKLRKAERATESEASQFHRDDVPSYQPEPEYHGRGNHADEGYDEEGGHVSALLQSHQHRLGGGGGTSLEVPQIAPRAVTRAQPREEEDDDASVGDLLPM